MLIATWNSQGYKFCEGYIDKFLRECSLDVLCIQECGNLSGFFTNPDTYICRNDMYITKHGNYYLIYYPWSNHSRCSMAVMVKENYIIESATLFEVVIPRRKVSELLEETEDDKNDNEHRKGIRPIMRIRINTGLTSVTVCNTHLPSGCPSFARRIGYSFLTGYKPSNFIMVGDMNSLPDDWNLPTHIHVETAGKTYSWDNLSKCYDYCITDIGRPYAHDTYYPGNSDHLAAIFEFDI